MAKSNQGSQQGKVSKQKPGGGQVENAGDNRGLGDQDGNKAAGNSKSPGVTKR